MPTRKAKLSLPRLSRVLPFVLAFSCAPNQDDVDIDDADSDTAAVVSLEGRLDALVTVDESGSASIAYTLVPDEGDPVPLEGSAVEALAPGATYRIKGSASLGIDEDGGGIDVTEAELLSAAQAPVVKPNLLILGLSFNDDPFSGGYPVDFTTGLWEGIQEQVFGAQVSSGHFYEVVGHKQPVTDFQSYTLFQLPAGNAANACNLDAMLAYAISFGLRADSPALRQQTLAVLSKPNLHIAMIHRARCPAIGYSASIGPRRVVVPPWVAGDSPVTINVPFGDYPYLPDVLTNGPRRDTFTKYVLQGTATNFGLQRSNRLRCSGDGFLTSSNLGACSSISYGDPWSLMGNGEGVQPDPFLDLAAHQKRQLGILAPQRSVLFGKNDTAKSYKIGSSRTSAIAGDAVHEVVVPINGTLEYSIAYQPPPPQPRNASNMGGGVQIHLAEVNGQGLRTSSLVDMRPDTPGLEDTALDLGGGQRKNGRVCDTSARVCFQMTGVAGGAASVTVRRFGEAVVVNAASQLPGDALAPGSLVTIYGSDLANPGAPGVSRIRVTGPDGVERDMATTYEGEDQINAILPDDLPEGDAIVTVYPDEAELSPSTAKIHVERFEPALFSDGGKAVGYLVRVHDGTQSYESLSSPIDFGPEGDDIYLV
ncbi:MAG: hypothetical protein JNK04_21600, partial [Myxococcales bacterium]|nr:hypothetical protein [Myxococcales bacterium]